MFYQENIIDNELFYYAKISCASFDENHMKYLILIILTFNLSCITQKSEVTDKSNTELKPPFTTQGEQEDYWAQEFFKKEYKKFPYEIYSGEIKEFDETKFIYKNKSFQIYDINESLKIIFSKGILYPQLISGFTTEPRKSDKELDSLTNSERYFYDLSRGDNLIITELEEIQFLSNSPKIKRFRFWLNRPNSANPQVYLFELIIEKANKNTDLKEFIENSKLTFLKEGWIIL